MCPRHSRRWRCRHWCCCESTTWDRHCGRVHCHTRLRSNHRSPAPMHTHTLTNPPTMTHPTTTRLSHRAFVLVPLLCDALTKIHLDPPVVNQHVVHLDVGFLAALLAFKLEERVLQRRARFRVAHHVARQDVPKPRKDQLQALPVRDLVQLAHEQHVLGRCGVRVVNVAQNLERFRRPLSDLGRVRQRCLSLGLLAGAAPLATSGADHSRYCFSRARCASDLRG